MRTYEAQSKDYTDYHEAREAFNNFCARAGLEPTTDDAAGGLEYKFHIHIQKIEKHENIEANICGLSFGYGSHNGAGSEIRSPLAKW